MQNYAFACESMLHNSIYKYHHSHVLGMSKIRIMLKNRMVWSFGMNLKIQFRLLPEALERIII